MPDHPACPMLLLAGALISASAQPSTATPARAADSGAALSTARPVSAPAIASRTRRTRNIGAAAGFVAGYGLSYRHWLADSKAGFQVTAIPVASLSPGARLLDISMGGLALRSLTETPSTNFFAYAGAHYIFHFEEGQDGPVNTESPSGVDWDQRIHTSYAGTGIGLEAYAWNRRINMTAMLGYAAMAEWKSHCKQCEERTYHWMLGLQPSVEIGLFYSP